MKTITSEAIQATFAFGAISDNVQRALTLNKASRKEINNGFSIASNIGFQEWNRIYCPNLRVSNIVKELVNN